MRPIETGTMTKLGQAVAEQVRLRGWTLGEASERLGWADGRLSHWCRRESVTVADVRAVADLLGLDLGRLLELDERSAK